MASFWTTAMASLSGLSAGQYRPLVGDGGKPWVTAASDEDLRCWRYGEGPPCAAFTTPQIGPTQEVTPPQPREGSKNGFDVDPSLTQPLDVEVDIVQFSSFIYLVEESEKKLRIDVMRLGGMKGRVEVNFQTADGSGKAGTRYIATFGTLVFEDGESEKSFEVEIVEDDLWSATLEFKVVLSNPVNCHLGAYLHTCRVKVIDNNPFPSDKFREELSQGLEGILKINTPSLFWEFVKLAYHVPGINVRTLLAIFIDQLHNLHLFLNLTINLYLVDVVFKHDDESLEELIIPGNRVASAKLMAIAFVLPMLVIHIGDVIRLRMDVAGRIKDYIQRSLFRKYLNYSEASRLELSSADLQIAITRDSVDLAMGYEGLLKSLKVVGKLAVLFLFVAKESPEALWCCFVIPSLMCGFAVLRNHSLQEAVGAVGETSSQMVALVDQACTRYKLISDYAQRPKINDLFEKNTNEHRVVSLPEALIRTNNDYFPRWLGPLFVGSFIWTNADAVIAGDVSLGCMLATINVFMNISSDAAELYSLVMDITTTFDALRTIAVYLNLGTDLMALKAVNRIRREQTQQARQDVLKLPLNSDVMFRSDMIPIKVTGMSFSYRAGTPILKDVNLSVPQGKLVAVLSQHGGGKATFLQLLAHSIFPSSGSIFIPIHLRILHVSREPILFSESAWLNLTFGIADPTNISIEDAIRIRAILEALNMQATLKLVAPQLSKALEEPLPADGEPVGRWHDEITYTEQVKIHLARALVVNPEVLVLQRPLHHYDGEASLSIMKVIRDHVNSRGVGVPENQVKRRRPRTVFMSPETTQQASQADVIWQIDQSTLGVQEASPFQFMTEPYVIRNSGRVLSSKSCC